MTCCAEMKTKISAEFGLAGFDIDPDEITALTGIQPSVASRAGEPLGTRGQVRRKRSTWVVRSDEEESLDTEGHMRAVLARLQPGWQVLSDLGHRYEASLGYIVYAYDQLPPLYFAPEVVRQASELGGYLEVDLYILSDEVAQ